MASPNHSLLRARGGENLPAWRGQRGMYEVWYLTFNVPDSRAAFWLRYTMEAPLHGTPYAELWGHYFDDEDPSRSFGLRQRFEEGAFELGKEGALAAIGEAVLREGEAIGALAGDGHRLQWKLRFSKAERAWFVAPPWLHGFLSRKRTWWCVPNIDVRFEGEIEVDGRTVTVSGARGQQAHLYGGRHAEGWAWAHCNSFDEGREAIVEAVAADLRLAGLRRTVTAVYVRYEGTDYLLNALPGALACRSERSFPSWSFRAKAKDGTEFRGTLNADRERMLQVRYADPDGTESYCCNSELGGLVLEVHRDGRIIDTLTSTRRAHLEFGSRARRDDVRMGFGS